MPATRKQQPRSAAHPLRTIRDRVETYLADVEHRRIPACELIRCAVERHRRDLAQGAARGLSFDWAAAEAACVFIEHLRHSRGEWAGQPFVLAGWQLFIVASLFGWKRRDGTRRFRTAYVEVPRKNGKSQLAAAIGLKLAFADSEPGAEVYSAATKRDQALIVHGEAQRMVKATPELARRVTVLRHNLSRPDLAQKFEPLGADEDTLDGLHVHGAIIDELHAHRTRGIWDVILTATSARRQPLTIAITTAGQDPTDASVCWEQHVYAEQLLRGVIEDDTYFAFIAALEQADLGRWHDESLWYAVNPNLGVSKKIDYLREQAKQAARIPSKLTTFLRLELNVWSQETPRWIDLGLWDEQAGAPIDERSLVGRRAVAGLDLSSVSDLSAFVLLFPEPDGRLTILPRLWCPEAKLQDDERNRYREQYRAWARDGWIRVTPGNAIDYEAIEAQIAQDAQTFQIESIAIDRLYQGYMLAMRLQEQHGLQVAACGMGFLSMAGPCAEFERRLLARQLHHGGHPVLRWMASNVVVREDPAGNKKPDKASSQGKIDGIVALLLALDRLMRQAPPTESTSVYESRGALIF